MMMTPVKACGEIIMIVRKSQTAGEATSYRLVVTRETEVSYQAVQETIHGFL